MKDYCTQTNSDCKTCSLSSYNRDCRNNPIKGGARPGAGRKPEGRKSRTMRLSDTEYEAVKAYLDKRSVFDMAEFKWDSEKVLKTIVKGKTQFVVKATTLKGQEYIGWTKLAEVKGDLKPVGGAAVPVEVFREIYGVVS